MRLVNVIKSLLSYRMFKQVVPSDCWYISTVTMKLPPGGFCFRIAYLAIPAIPVRSALRRKHYFVCTSFGVTYAIAITSTLVRCKSLQGDLGCILLGVVHIIAVIPVTSAAKFKSCEKKYYTPRGATTYGQWMRNCQW